MSQKSYAFNPEYSLRKNVRVVATSIHDEGLLVLEEWESDPVSTVHEIRKHCKKIRGLIRLVHPVWTGPVRSENDFYRDAAMLLSDVRDAHISIEAFDLLNVEGSDSFTEFRHFLVSRCHSIEDSGGGLVQRLTAVKERFVQGRQRTEEWPVEPVSSVLLQEGFYKTTRRIRRDMRVAIDNPTTENYHEWRKSVKNHYYHVCLLEPLWPEEMTPYKEMLDELTDLLGSERDLFSLGEALSEMDPKAIAAESMASLDTQIQDRRTELREQALGLGKIVCDWNPVPLLERVHYYWGVGFE